VTGSCAAGSSIRIISESGTVTCETDTDTQFALENVIFVAKSGGDFTSIQDAIDSVKDAAEDNPYLVWVAPGIYEEQVTLVPYVHLQGAGKAVTAISSDADSTGTYPTEATLQLTDHVTVRDLTVLNTGDAQQGAALLATFGTTETVVSNVAVESNGGADYTTGICLQGSGTRVTLVEVTAVAEGGANACRAFWNDGGATGVVLGGTYVARGTKCAAEAMYNGTSGTELQAYGVSALAEGSEDSNVALVISNTVAVVRGGSFVANGVGAVGIDNYGGSAYLDADGVTVLAEFSGDTEEATGLSNTNGADAVVRGGSLTARGAYGARGIHNDGSSTTLSLDGTAVVGEDCDYSCVGLRNSAGATAELLGSSFLGTGGSYADGIATNHSTLYAVAVSARGDGTGSVSYGVSSGGATAYSLITQSQLKGAERAVYHSGSGVITVTNSLLIGGPPSSGVDCLLVVRGTNVSADVPPYTCP
jgi:hypothetical protein